MGKYEQLPNKNVAISKIIGTGGYPTSVHGIRFIHWLMLSQELAIKGFYEQLNLKEDPNYIILDLNDFRDFYGIKSKDNKPLWRGVYDATSQRMESEIEGASKYTALFTELVMPYSMAKSKELSPSKENKSYIKKQCIRLNQPYSSTSFLVKLTTSMDLVREFYNPSMFAVVNPIMYRTSKTVNQVQFYLKCASHVNLRNGFAWKYFVMIDEMGPGLRAKAESDRVELIDHYKNNLSEFKKKVLRPLVAHINDVTDLRLELEERKKEAIIKVRRAVEIDEKQAAFKQQFSHLLKSLEVNPLSLQKMLTPTTQIFVDSIMSQAVSQFKSKLIREGEVWKHRGTNKVIENIGSYSCKSLINELELVLDEKAITYDFNQVRVDAPKYGYEFEENEFDEIRQAYFKTMESKGLLPRDLFKHLLLIAQERITNDKL